MEMRKNVALIGMAGVGKSTTGEKLGERLGYRCVECDELMTEEATRRGVNKFLLSDPEFVALENDVILTLTDATQTIIDTGGSAIYSSEAMAMLKDTSVIIYLKDSIDSIEQRFIARGMPHVVGIENKTFQELFRERTQLYEQYADITADISGHPALDHTIDKIMEWLEQTQN
ncbi:MAG: Shikimate kinase [Capsulimonas sp.]|nr:Shikimate kinase [Capsulimonas sp.]